MNLCSNDDFILQVLRHTLRYIYPNREPMTDNAVCKHASRRTSNLPPKVKLETQKIEATLLAASRPRGTLLTDTDCDDDTALLLLMYGDVIALQYYRCHLTQ